MIHHALPLPCRQARAGEALLLRRALGAFVCTALPQGRPARCPLNSVIEQFSGIRWTLPLLPATGANHCLMQPLSLFWNTARACQQRRQPWGEGVEALQHHAEAALDYCRLASTCLHPTFSTASSQSWLLTPVTFESSMGAPTQLLCDVRNPPSALGNQSQPLGRCTKIAAPGSPHGLLVHAERRHLADGNLPHAETSLSLEPHDNKV